jgi:tRNA pseudouridine38-40 synthase
MVRNIVGSLMAVGSGKHSAGWTAEVFALKDRRKAAMTAAPNGLYLVNVDYPAHYDLPVAPPGPAFLAPLLAE